MTNYRQDWLGIIPRDEVTIIHNQNEITCRELLKQKPNNLKIIAIVSQLLNNLPQPSYPDLSLCFQRLISLPGKSNRAIAYLQQELLVESIGENLRGGKINLTYQLPHCPLYFTLQSAFIKDKDNHLLPALAFSGQFSYGNQDINAIEEIINNWREDWSTFRKLVNQGFLR